MIYLDTSFLTPLFRQEEDSAEVEAFLAKQAPGSLAISHWTRVEFASVIARDVRMKALPKGLATALLEEFDALAESALHVLSPTTADFDLAQQYVAEFAIHLRGPDALHLAIANNQGAEQVISLDDGMLTAARKLGISAKRGAR